MISDWISRFFGFHATGRPPAARLREFTELETLNSCFSASSSRSILCFGDSVWTRVSNGDTDSATLGQMVDEGLVAASLERSLQITQVAYHPGIFAAFVEALQALPFRPRVIVLPINLRSFSPQWDLRPQWQFAPEISALRSFAAKPITPLPCVPIYMDEPASDKTFQETQAHFHGMGLRRLDEFLRAVKTKPAQGGKRALRSKTLFTFHYMYHLSPEHRHLHGLRELQERCAKMEVSLIPYLTPINYEAGRTFVSSDFMATVEANIETIRRSLNSFPLHDYSTLLPSTAFFHERDSTEHLNQKGRRELAAHVVDAIAATLHLQTLQAKVANSFNANGLPLSP